MATQSLDSVDLSACHPGILLRLMYMSLGRAYAVTRRLLTRDSGVVGRTESVHAVMKSFAALTAAVGSGDEERMYVKGHAVFVQLHPIQGLMKCFAWCSAQKLCRCGYGR